LALAVGARLGPYEILSLIGAGGMGEVYRAHDTRLRRTVAIKRLHRDHGSDLWRRLLREARAAAALSHPGIVTVHSVEQLEDECFIVMELVDGVTLADRLTRGPLEFSELCEIAVQIAEALAAAHAVGIVHGDLTPRNILLAPGGRAKLTDFGLARAVAPQTDSQESTRSVPQVAGTIHYMSPEQLRGEPWTCATDLFSLGTVLYYGATGCRPFEGPTAFAVMHAIAMHEPEPPSAVQQGIPAAFDALVGQLLTKRVEERTVNARQVAAALRILATSDHSRIPDVSDCTLRDRVPFVGRARELGVLFSLLARALAGTGTTILVTGEAGAGKTSLIDAFLHAPETLAANPLICRGQSIEYTGVGEAYFPLIDALTPLVAHEDGALHQLLRTHAPSWCAQFRSAYLEKEVGSEGPTATRLAREFGDVLSAAAQSRPVIVVVEDLHWSDPSTIELLQHLAHRATRAALLIVATYRTGDASAVGPRLDQIASELEARRMCQTLELGRFEEHSLQEYLKRRFNLRDELPALASFLFNATEGNPLFVVSLVQLLVERGDLQEVDGAWCLNKPCERLQLVIPRTIQAVIRRKFDAIEDDDRRLLQYASVVGREFSSAVLSDLLGADTVLVEDRLDMLAGRLRLIAPISPERIAGGVWATRYQFAHALYQSAIYDQLSPSRKADIHSQVGKRLARLNAGKTDEIAAQLARHFMEGRDWNTAFNYFLQAGDNAMTLSAAREAEMHYAQAVELASVEGSRVEPQGRAIALWKRGTTRGFLGSAEGALTDYRDALAAASVAGDRGLMFDIRLGTVYAHSLAEDIDAASAAAATLEQDVEPPPGGLKRLRYLLAHLQLHAAKGDLDEAANEANIAVKLAQSLTDAVRLSHAATLRGMVEYFRANYDTALQDLREVGREPTCRRRLADPRPANVRFHSSVYLGRVLGDLGNISGALATLHSGLESARSDGYLYWIPRLLNAIIEFHCDIEVVDSAQLPTGWSDAQTDEQANETRIESRVNRAAAWLQLGDLSRARDLLTEADALTSVNTWYYWRWRTRFTLVAAEEALRRGAYARATALAEEGNALARRHCCWKQVVCAERLLAESAGSEGQWRTADGHVEEALGVLRRHAVPIIAWKVHATAARVWRESGRHTDAATQREQARGAVIALSQLIHQEKLQTAFLESDNIHSVLN
jgi:tetratricopeptide (TPR) repeat protein